MEPDKTSEIGPWNEYAESAPPDTESGPWNEYAEFEKKIFDPTRKQRMLLQDAFTGDPLSFIDDPKVRSSLEFQLNAAENPEEEKKKWALAAYFAGSRRENIIFCHDNLDEFIAKYNVDRSAQSVEQAYNDIAEIFQKRQEGELAQHGHSLLSGVFQVPATIWNQYAKWNSWGLNLLTEIMSPLMSEEDYQWNKDYARLAEDVQRGIARNYEDLSAEEDEKSQRNPNFISDLLTGNYDNVSPYDFTKALLQSSPDMALQYMVFAANPYAGVAYNTSTSGINKLYLLEENHPEIQGAAKYTNAGVTAVVNGLLEMATAKITGGGFTQEQAAEAVKKGLLKYLGNSFWKEGATESSQQLGENLTDLFTGVYGDLGTMSPEEKMRYTFQGVTEAGFIGGAYGPVFGYGGFRNLKKMDQYRVQARARLEERREQLMQKETLTPEEEANLKEINVKLDAGNLNDLASVEFETELRQELDASREGNQAIQNTPEYTSIESEAWEGATEEEIRDAARVSKRLELQRKLPHNPQDTVDAVREVARQYPDVTFQVVRNENEFPPEIREELRRRFGKTRAASAFYYNDEVWINAGKLKPSQVEAKILHEVVGHKGLRMLFPNDRSFDAILDNIYREHFNEPGFDRVAQLNFPFHERVFETDVETGEESGSGRVNLETAEDQRLAAEEYVASIAESGMPKPNWWKEFLQSVRMWIADRFPHARQVRMTDREIETLLARSARAARRNRRGNGKVIAPESAKFAAENFLSEEYFRNPDGDRELPSPHLVLQSLGKAEKPLVLKKNIVEKNKKHNDLSFDDIVTILNDSIYQCDLVIQPNPVNRSSYFMLVSRSSKNRQTLIEINELKERYEIVNYHYLGRRQLDQKIKRARQQNGLVQEISRDGLPDSIITENGAAGRLSALPANTNITSSGEKSSGNSGAVYSVDSVWTGSAASYDAPSLQYIGTGEGQQVYGWGLYGSSSRKVGEWYAKEDVKRKNRERILLDGKEPDLDRMDKLERNVLLDVLGRKGSISGTLEYYRLDLNKPRNPHFYDDSEEIRAQAKWLENNKDRIEYIPENQNSSGRRNLYRQTFWPGKEENLLDWDNPVTEAQRKKIEEQLKKEGLFVEGDPDKASEEYRELKKKQNSGGEVSQEELDAAYEKAERLHAQRNVTGTTINGDIPSGSMAYENLEDILGSPKAASEFLYRAGIDGVTFVGNSSGVRNYVAFSDQDIRVDEHIRFSVEPEVESPEFKRWFGKSKMVDENGNPRIFYHGTNEDFYVFNTEAPQAHDAGFYGKGLYFDFWDWEAKYYGERVIPVYLKVEKPFDFSKMLSYKGKSVQYVGADSLCFLYNIAKKFPELEGKVSMPSIGKWENDVLVEEPALTFREYIDLVEDTEKRLSFCEVGEENGTRIDIEFDTHEFDEWNGEKFPVTITIMRNVLQSDTPENRREMLSAATFIALREVYNISVDYHPEGIMTRSPEITDAIKKQGYDGIIQSPDGDEVVVFSPNQIKSATDNIGTFDPENPDIRFAVSEFSADEESDIIALLRPFVGVYMSKSDAEIVDYLRRHGVELSEEEAHAFHKLASDENRAEARKRSAKQRNDWLYENVPVWQQTVDTAGSENFKIVPSMRFRDEEMSGTFIARKKESGMNSDELAQTIARKTGRDPLEVEQEIMDFFRDLKKPDLYRLYSDWKKQSALGDREAERRAREEWEKQEKIRIEDEAISIIEHGSPVSAEWAAENLPIYRELYRQLFHTDEAPSSIRSGDVESLNAALAQQQGDAAVFAQAYREARKKSYEEFNERLRELREKVLASKADALKLQRQALAFAENHLPQENRGEFSRAIVKLLEYSTAPTAKNPDGRRAAEFRRLFDSILERSANVRREKAVTEINEMLDAAKIKRNYKGIPTSVLPSEQQKVDRIRKIVSLDLAAVANLIEYNNELIGRIENGQEEGRTAEAVLEDNALIETFGNLKHRSADDAENAARQLRNLISGGKAAFAEKLAARRAELDDMRRRAVDDATFGRNSFSSRSNAKKHFEYILRHESLGTVLRIVSGKSIQDFDHSIGGELYRKVEKASGDEMTRQRLAQKALDQAMRDIAGVDSMRKKGKFLRMLTKVEEHSGVHKIEYSRPVRVGENDFVYEEGRRQLVSKSIPIEDYEFEGKPRKGARSILRDIDNGTRVAAVAGIPIDDVAAAFLRQQIADFDAGIRQSYEIFNEEADDANFNRMIEEERDGGRVVVFGHNPEEESKSVEVPLSQGAALQILLTWEQEHYQPNMKWNGWTEKSIAELRKFIRPEVLKLGYWMRDEIARHRPELDRKVFERYGAHLPENSNYFPAAFRGARARAVKADSGLARGAGSLSLNPSFLIARKFHLNPVDLDANAFSTFLGNQLDQHHFLAWSDALRDLKGVYGNSTVQKAINANFGKNVTDNLLDRIETQVRGGGKFTGEYVARFLNPMYRFWIPAKIMINQGSVIKQMFGTAAYMNHMPVADFCKNLAMANFTNPEFREFVRYARNTDYMKNRLWGGLDKDLQYLMNYTMDSRVYSPFNDALIRFGTMPTRWADAWSSLHGGFAVYKYNLEQAKKSGMSQAEAHDAAIRAWMRATDETQQSGFLKDQNYFQANQGLYRYLTAFLTNPIQVMNLQLQTINELRYGSDKKAALRKLGRQIFVNHLVVPTLMLFTNDMLRHGFNVAEWWDEVEFEDYLLAWGLGNFESLFLFGKLMSGIGNYALDRIIGRPAYQRTLISALPLGDDIQRDINTISRIVKNGELTEKELFDAIRAIGDFGMAAGTLDSRAGAVGALLSAIGTQGKRVAKWISGE